jgi:hypothetical protein
MTYPNLKKYGPTEQFRREAKGYKYAVNDRRAMKSGGGKKRGAPHGNRRRRLTAPPQGPLRAYRGITAMAEAPAAVLPSESTVLTPFFQ